MTHGLMRGLEAAPKQFEVHAEV